MLEINVNEQTYITDSMEKALAIIEKIIQKVIIENIDSPINISVSKPRANSPPALGINVSENSSIIDRLV